MSLSFFSCMKYISQKYLWYELEYVGHARWSNFEDTSKDPCWSLYNQVLSHRWGQLHTHIVLQSPKFAIILYSWSYSDTIKFPIYLVWYFPITNNLINTFQSRITSARDFLPWHVDTYLLVLVRVDETMRTVSKLTKEYNWEINVARAILVSNESYHRAMIQTLTWNISAWWKWEQIEIIAFYNM